MHKLQIFKSICCSLYKSSFSNPFKNWKPVGYRYALLKIIIILCVKGDLVSSVLGDTVQPITFPDIVTICSCPYILLYVFSVCCKYKFCRPLCTSLSTNVLRINVGCQLSTFQHVYKILATFENTEWQTSYHFFPVRFGSLYTMPRDFRPWGNFYFN